MRYILGLVSGLAIAGAVLSWPRANAAKAPGCAELRAAVAQEEKASADVEKTLATYLSHGKMPQTSALFVKNLADSRVQLHLLTERMARACPVTAGPRL